MCEARIRHNPYRIHVDLNTVIPSLCLDLRIHHPTTSLSILRGTVRSTIHSGRWQLGIDLIRLPAKIPVEIVAQRFNSTRQSFDADVAPRTNEIEGYLNIYAHFCSSLWTRVAATQAVDSARYR